MRATRRILLLLTLTGLIAGCAALENDSIPFSAAVGGGLYQPEVPEEPAPAVLQGSAPVEGDTPLVESAPEIVDQAPELRARAWKSYQQNIGGLRGLRWQTRTTLPVAGAYTIESLHKIRTDINGDLVRTHAVSHRRAPSNYATHVQEIPEEVAQMWAGKLADLAHAYVAAPGGVYQRFLNEGALEETKHPLHYAVRGTDLVMPGDSAVYTFHKLTGAPIQLEFNAVVDGEPVQGLTTYRSLPDGADYPSRTVLTLPGPNITATVENFDYAPEVRR